MCKATVGPRFAPPRGSPTRLSRRKAPRRIDRHLRGVSIRRYKFRQVVLRIHGGTTRRQSISVSRSPWIQRFHRGSTTPKILIRADLLQSWNLTFKGRSRKTVLVSASYLGSQSYHLWVERELNRAVFFPGAPVNGVCRVDSYVLQTTGATCSTTGNTNQRRRLVLENPQEGQYFGNMATREASGTQSYHGLLLSIQRRASSGVNIRW